MSTKLKPTLTMEQRKITIVTSTRADWGLLRPLAAALRSRNDVVLSIIATNMHLDPAYGYTVSEIEADGFRVEARVPIQPCTPWRPLP